MAWLTNWAVNFAADFEQCFIKDDRYKLLIDGLGMTLKVAFVATLIGIAIGFVIAMFNLSHIKILNIIGGIYTDVIRGTPSVTQVMIIYFGIFAQIAWDKWLIAALAFGVNSGGYVAEIFRAGILSIDQGQTEAGRSLGLSSSQTMIWIILPQAIKNIFPTLCNEFIVLIKETAIMGYIGLMDIQKAGDYIKSATFKIWMPLLTVAIIYYVLIKILTTLLGYVEEQLRKSDAR